MSKMWKTWKQIRKHQPRHAAIDTFVVDYLFDDRKWWDSGAAKWRAALFNSCCEITEQIRHRWPWCSHSVTDDQCGMPEHRYCVFCMDPTPNAPVSA